MIKIIFKSLMKFNSEFYRISILFFFYQFLILADPYGIVFPDRAFPEGRAWLISDPIVCQTGDGELTFRLSQKIF